MSVAETERTFGTRSKRREALYDELERLGSQVFMTGADSALFERLASRAEIFLVTPGRLTGPQ